ncbi:MAG: chorismate mutase [Spirochaetes bacterium]|nr:chorismate mutase [Spirochaetota bacterium]
MIKNLINTKKYLKIIENKRKKINIIDRNIINLLIKRTILANDIIELKKKLGFDINDSKRENEILENVEKYINKIFLKKIFKTKNQFENKKKEINFFNQIKRIYEIIFYISKNTNIKS